MRKKFMACSLRAVHSVVYFLGVMFLIVSFSAEAQQPKKIPRIGWIAFDGSRPNRDFMTPLRELGYIEGQSITIECRSAQGQEDRLSEIAAELVRSKVDVIVAASNAATDAAKKASTTTPILCDGLRDSVWY